MNLKVLSWNIWVDGNIEQVQEFLREADADIVGLQEVQKDVPGRDIVGFMESLGYHHAFAPEQLWKTKGFLFGPAVFSKYEITSSETLVLSAEEKRVAAKASVSADGRILHILSTHLMHTHRAPSALQEAQADSLISASGERTIIMGDFNATPESRTIQKMRTAFTDSDPSGEPTWSLYPEGCSVCNLQGVEIRFDYIFASKDLRVSEPKVERSPASDHLPISCIVEV